MSENEKILWLKVVHREAQEGIHFGGRRARGGRRKGDLKRMYREQQSKQPATGCMHTGVLYSQLDSSTVS